jgi:PAS domain S-box-containing protein
MKSKIIYPRSVNLYIFIRLILGNDITDKRIAMRWKMDGKNFHEFKTGVYPVPRLEKLEELANVLGINKHLVFQVAGGTSPEKVYDLIAKNDLRGQVKLLSSQLDREHKHFITAERKYRELFNHASDAIFIADVKTGTIIDCNKQAEKLTGMLKTEIIGMNQSKLHPSKRKKYYKKYFRSHVKIGHVNDLRKAEVINKKGKIIPVYISASVVEINGKSMIQGIFRDIRQKRN